MEELQKQKYRMPTNTVKFQALKFWSILFTVLGGLFGLSTWLFGLTATLWIGFSVGVLAVVFVLWLAYLAANDPTFHNECCGA